MVRRALFWSFASQIAGFAIQFGTSIVMARLLSPEEMGVYAVAWSVIGIVQLFTGFSIATYVIREPHLTPATLDTAYTINAVLSLALSALIFAASFIVGPFLSNAMVGIVLRLLAVTPIIGIVAFRPTVMLQRAMQLRGVSIVGTVAAAASAVVTITAAVLGQSSLSPAYGAIVAGTLTAIGAILVGREHHSLRLSVQGWRPMTAFGLRLMSIGGIATTATRVSDVILGRLLGLAALGLYNRANNLSNLLFTNVYGSATRVVFAKLSEAQRDQDRVTEVFMRGLRLILGIMVPLDLGLAVLSKPAIHTLYGDQWLGAAVPLSLLMIAQVISLSFAMNWELFVIRDDLKTQTKLELIRSLVGVLSQTVGCFISLAAVAASSVFDAIVSVMLYKRHMVRLTRAPEAHLYRVYAEALALGFAASVPSLILMILTDWDPHVHLALLTIAVGAGVALWAALAFALDHPLRDEVRLLQTKLGLRLPRTAEAHPTGAGGGP